jgi:hypothetical protein|tara:strand:- start:625 stop:801 length:177 start_codon:yes stop_codon:yes gene_type:complete
MTEEDIDVIEISEEEVNLSIGGTRLTISGIISKRHAQILVILILGMLGYNHSYIMGLI